MKKFLVFLLIAIITCEAVEKLDLQGIKPPVDPTKLIAQKLKEIIVSYGKKVAVDYCSKYFSKDVCQTAVDQLASALGL